MHAADHCARERSNLGNKSDSACPRGTTTLRILLARLPGPIVGRHVVVRAPSIQRHWLPCARAALAIGRRDCDVALDELEPARAIELAICQPFEVSMMLPVWMRSVALQEAARGAEATRERAKITERPGLAKNSLLFLLAAQQGGNTRSAWT